MVMNVETVNPYKFKTLLGDIKILVGQGARDEAQRLTQELLVGGEQMKVVEPGLPHGGYLAPHRKAFYEHSGYLALHQAAVEVLSVLTSAASGMNGDVSLLMSLHKLDLAVEQLLPDFRIVLLNETAQWNDPKLVEEAGAIWSAYLYDARRPVHLAELTPSYELTHLYTSAQNHVSDDVHEMLMRHGGPEERVMYMRCSAVDAIGWDRKHVCSEPNDISCETYQDLLNGEREHYVGNYAIDVPRPLGPQQVAQFAERLVNIGERQGAVDLMAAQFPNFDALHVTAHAMVTGRPGAARDATFLEELQRVCAAVTEQRTMPEEPAAQDELVRARAARKFFDELLNGHETVGGIEQTHGARTLTDLFYLMNSILKGEHIDVHPDSKVADVLLELPSADEWMAHTVHFNNYGEQIARPVHATTGRSHELDASPSI